MRKLWICLVLSLLFLTGCANTGDEATETTVPTETEPAGSYLADSKVEADTNGAVWQYKLDYTGYKWIKAMGDNLLMASDSAVAKLQAINGDLGVSVGFAEIPKESLDSCTAMFNGFAYYNDADHTVVYLDTQLNEFRSVSLTDNTSLPVIAPDGGEIFYYTGTQIRALDTERNISRLIREPSAQVHRLLGTCLDGKVLIYSVGETEESAETVYISAENGQTLWTGSDISQIDTYENTYFAVRQDGLVLQRIYGNLDGEAKLLLAPDEEVFAALELGGAVGYTPTEGGIALNFYDLTSGTKTSAVAIPGLTQVKKIVADRWSGSVWLLATGASCGGDELLRWDLHASAVQEDVSYFGTLYTSQYPDESGIQACQSRVDELNNTYNVRIRIWQDAVQTPGRYQLVPEHQTSTISTVLDALEPVLAEFPKNFLLKSLSTRIRICIVRSLDGGDTSAQYWDGDDAYIVLPVGGDVRRNFLRSFGYVIDSHVLGNSAKFDYWNSLNPEDFVYGQPDEKYLDKQTASFADAESMTSAIADRSSVFCNAMLPDNGELFQSEVMQNKLLLLCQAIRDAWNLEWKTEIYPWEQYLSQPIAHQK